MRHIYAKQYPKPGSAAIPIMVAILLSALRFISVFILVFIPMRAAARSPVSVLRLGSSVASSVEASSAGMTTGLQISEIMYNPPDDGSIPGANLEFLELHNRTDQALDLSDAYFVSGIDYRFATGATLLPGTHLVLARSSGDFEQKYDFAPDGEYIGQLNNSGERIALNAADGSTIVSVRYNDRPPWPTSPDGSGFSLVLRHPDDPDINLDDGAHWRASSREGGSPGMADPPSATETPAILINEVLPHTDFPLTDSVEIYNSTDAAVDVGGWFLTDDRTRPRRFRIPDGLTLAPNQYHVFNEDELGFSFSSFGDEAYLFAAEPSGDLTGYSHGFAFGASANGVSFGRHLVSTGEETFPAQSQRSLGKVNVGPKVGPVVISEIMYHPPFGGDEYVKVANSSAQQIQLFGADNPQNTWRFNGIGNYVLPKGLILPAGGELLIVPMEPDQFRTEHSIPAEIQITGPFTGTLNNGGERLQLLEPDRQDADGTVPYFVVDEVRYSDSPPWPTAADGLGPSLRRAGLSAYGNDPANWRAGSWIYLPFVNSIAP